MAKLVQESMPVIGYIRVSKEEQATNGMSLDVQREKITAYCKLYDLELADIIEDAGESAKTLTLDRPGLQATLTRIDAGEAAGMVVAKLDRLTRSLGDWDQLIRGHFDRPENPVRLFSVNDSVDTRTANGRMALNMFVMIAQWERETIVERVKASMDYRRKQGMIICRDECLPWGKRRTNKLTCPRCGDRCGSFDPNAPTVVCPRCKCTGPANKFRKQLVENQHEMAAIFSMHQLLATHGDVSHSKLAKLMQQHRVANPRAGGMFVWCRKQVKRMRELHPPPWEVQPERIADEQPG